MPLTKESSINIIDLFLTILFVELNFNFTPNTAKIITNLLKIPTIGIGSSSYCDGQILVTDDIIGLSGFYPKFVKKYVNLNTVIEKAVKKYSKEVKTKVFPKNKNFLYGK